MFFVRHPSITPTEIEPIPAKLRLIERLQVTFAKMTRQKIY
jgi:hypothetical protein